MTEVPPSLLNKETNFLDPMRALSKEEMECMNLKYYNPEIHKASFVLPEFAKKVNVVTITFILHIGAQTVDTYLLPFTKCLLDH